MWYGPQPLYTTLLWLTICVGVIEPTGIVVSQGIDVCTKQLLSESPTRWISAVLSNAVPLMVSVKGVYWTAGDGLVLRLVMEIGWSTVAAEVPLLPSA